MYICKHITILYCVIQKNVVYINLSSSENFKYSPEAGNYKGTLLNFLVKMVHPQNFSIFGLLFHIFRLFFTFVWEVQKNLPYGKFFFSDL